MFRPEIEEIKVLPLPEDEARKDPEDGEEGQEEKKPSLSCKAFVKVLSSPFTILAGITGKPEWKLSDEEKEALLETCPAFRERFGLMDLARVAWVGFPLTFGAIFIGKLLTNREKKDNDNEEEEPGPLDTRETVQNNPVRLPKI